MYIYNVSCLLTFFIPVLIILRGWDNMQTVFSESYVLSLASIFACE